MGYSETTVMHLLLGVLSVPEPKFSNATVRAVRRRIMKALIRDNNEQAEAQLRPLVDLGLDFAEVCLLGDPGFLFKAEAAEASGIAYRREWLVARAELPPRPDADAFGRAEYSAGRSPRFDPELRWLLRNTALDSAESSHLATAPYLLEMLLRNRTRDIIDMTAGRADVDLLETLIAPDPRLHAALQT
jgi:hypothetical protein